LGGSKHNHSTAAAHRRSFDRLFWTSSYGVRMLLILDLDETLVYSTTTLLDRAGDFRVAEYVVYQRPGLEHFLRFVARDFETAIWSSSSSGYAQEIISHIFSSPSSLRFVWTRGRCTRRFDPETKESYWVKDLKKVRRLGVQARTDAHC